jgi:CheY-like chemotaxis protein
MPDGPPSKLVLVVDDFEDTRELYALHLRAAGYRVLTAENGDEAVRLARESRPDLVVMDLAMPVMDGWEAVRLLRTYPETQATPIIAVTGQANVANRTAAIDAGCERFLVKPCLPTELEAQIRQALAARA